MKPGDLVKVIDLYHNIYFYSKHPQPPRKNNVNDAYVSSNTIGIILESSDGKWVKWIISDGRVGWSYQNYMEIIHENR